MYGRNSYLNDGRYFLLFLTYFFYLERQVTLLGSSIRPKAIQLISTRFSVMLPSMPSSRFRATILLFQQQSSLGVLLTHCSLSLKFFKTHKTKHQVMLPSIPKLSIQSYYPVVSTKNFSSSFLVRLFIFTQHFRKNQNLFGTLFRNVELFRIRYTQPCLIKL